MGFKRSGGLSLYAPIRTEKTRPCSSFCAQAALSIAETCSARPSLGTTRRASALKNCFDGENDGSYEHKRYKGAACAARLPVFKIHGAEFLTAAWVPEDIADSAGIDKDTGVFGDRPGIGCLTEQLSMRAGKVVSVEIDKALKPVLRETLGGCENVETVFDDVLKVDIPSLLDEKCRECDTLCAQICRIM